MLEAIDGRDDRSLWLRPELTLPLPPRIRSLPRFRGYPVPWFVGELNGEPEFRGMNARKLVEAVKAKLCWVCGQQLGVHKTFTVGPMCGVNRVSAEPPSHYSCAEWAARNCPFLTRPHAKRREDDEFNAEKKPSAGFMIARNPGVALLWTVRDFKPFNDGKGGVLFHLGEPEGLEFFREGRKATREEILASVDGGLPILLQACKDDPRDPAGAYTALDKLYKKFLTLIPA